MRVLIILILLINSVYAISINEVMPDPDDKCSDCTEWVELFNVSDEFVIDAGGVNTSILLNKTYEFLVLTENLTEFKKIYGNISNLIYAKMSLNNKGDVINIYINETLVDTFTYNYSRKNETWCIINGKWNICSPTPGKLNSLSTLKINVNIRLPEVLFVGIEYKDPFYIKIENKENCSKKDYFLFNYTLISKNYTYSNFFEREIGCSGYAGTGKILAKNSGSYKLCINLLNSTLNLTFQKCFNLSFINLPFSINYTINNMFGHYGMVYIEFNSTKFPYNEAIALVYGREKRIVIDNNGNEITANKYEKGTYFKTKTDAYITVPFLLKRNCNNYYKDGSYTIYLSIFVNNTRKFERFFEIPIYIHVKSDDSICPKTIVKEVIKKKKVFVKEKKILKLLNITYVNGTIEVWLRLLKGNYTIYSYLYGDRKILSFFKKGNKTYKNWKANEMKLSLNSTTNIKSHVFVKNNWNGSAVFRIVIINNGKRYRIDIPFVLIRKDIVKEKVILKNCEKERNYTDKTTGLIVRKKVRIVEKILIAAEEIRKNIKTLISDILSSILGTIT